MSSALAPSHRVPSGCTGSPEDGVAHLFASAISAYLHFVSKHTGHLRSGILPPAGNAPSPPSPALAPTVPDIFLLFSSYRRGGCLDHVARDPAARGKGPGRDRGPQAREPKQQQQSRQGFQGQRGPARRRSLLAQTYYGGGLGGQRSGDAVPPGESRRQTSPSGLATVTLPYGPSAPSARSVLQEPGKKNTLN
ncbi:hypothetical protein SKAU_G00335000 [Synaphobranchus kaupii]|uniref:Uncharacterized protein n=1 Tax=Synaphobranchus kaupii TaxID=118154 RepID=A0A9Q1ELS8_SYNKA|nr:hypothetical protein SKAU_G00335000 [Synaphobranchus kaupii]